MPFYISKINGCVYSLDPQDNNIMLYTPLNENNTFNSDIEEWIEVDFMLLMDEAYTNRTECEYALSLLSSIEYN